MHVVSDIRTGCHCLNFGAICNGIRLESDMIVCLISAANRSSRPVRSELGSSVVAVSVVIDKARVPVNDERTTLTFTFVENPVISEVFPRVSCLRFVASTLLSLCIQNVALALLMTKLHVQRKAEDTEFSNCSARQNKSELVFDVVSGHFSDLAVAARKLLK